MSILCRLHMHDFANVDLGRDFGHALECRRCRYQVRDRSAATPIDPVGGTAAPITRAASRRRA